MRSPAKGLWKNDGKTTRDDMVILEVMVRRVDRKWWNDHRAELQRRFEQKELVVRSAGHEIALAAGHYFFRRGLSPLSPCPGLALVLDSDAGLPRDRPTSSLSLNRPLAPRRTYRLSLPVLMSSRRAAFFRVFAIPALP